MASVYHNIVTLPDWARPLHWHPDFEIATAEFGVLDYQVGEHHIVLEAGDSIFVNGNMLHGIKQLSGDVPDPMPNIVFLEGALVGLVQGPDYFLLQEDSGKAFGDDFFHRVRAGSFFTRFLQVELLDFSDARFHVHALHFQSCFSDLCKGFITRLIPALDRMHDLVTGNLQERSLHVIRFGRFIGDFKTTIKG